MFPMVGEQAELLGRQRLQIPPKTSLIFHREGAPMGDFRKS